MERDRVFVPVVLTVISCLILLSVGYARPVDAGMRAELTNGHIDSKIETILLQRDRRQDDDNDGSQDGSEDQDNDEDSNVSQDSEASQDDESEASQDNETSQDNESEDEQSQSEASQDGQSENGEQSESQANQDSEASQDNESEDEQSQSEASQDGQSENSERSESQASQDNETSQDNESEDEQSQSEASQDEQSENSERSESQANQDSEASQDDESEDEQSQSEASQHGQSENSEQSESQANQDSEASQDDESEDEQSQSEASQDGQSENSEQSESQANQDGEASQDDESDDEQSQSEASRGGQSENSERSESQASQDNETSQDSESEDEQSQSEASQDEQSENSERSESQANQDSEASQDDESQGSEDDEQSHDQDEQSQDSESQATEASQNDETQSSQDEEQSQGGENQGNEQSQNDESQASQDNEESQDNESGASQDEQSQDDESGASQDEQSQDNENQDSEQSESQASQDNEASQDNKSQGSQENEQSQDQDEQSQNDESQNTQDGEQSQDQSQNEQSQATNQDGDQSQDNEESPEEESNANHDEESQADGEESDASQESQDSEASQDSEQSQDDNSAEESQNDSNQGDASQDDSDESQDSDKTQNLDNHTAPPDFEGTCAPDELLDLNEGAAVGDVAVGHCESGLFEGTWICQYDSELRAAKWVQIECNAPEDLEFATAAELIVADPVEAVGTVLEHINNHTVRLEVAASILERIMLVPAPTSKLLISGPYTADYTAVMLCQLSSILEYLKTLPKEKRGSAATKLLHAMDVFALKYAEPGKIDCGSVKVEIKYIVPGVDVVGIRVGQNSIVLPNPELRHSIGYSSVKAASFFFVDLSDILLDNATESGSSVVTPVISTALLCGNALCNTSYLELSKPVKITLEQSVPVTTNNNTKKSQERHNPCSFWQLLPNVYYPSTGTWSQRGCIVNKAESTSRTTVCECNHLTHFAVLLSPGVEFGEKHEFALRTIGYIGITISLFAMAITVFINMCFRSLWSMRTYIHINLCLSLMAALLLFVVAIDKTGNKIGCSVVAIALHYLFLVSFMWMLMEGVVLYVLLIKVFVEGSQRKYIIWFTVLSYGLPALYMCVTVPLGFLLNGEWHYGSDEMCWLRYDTHFIWAFIAPVILIIMINFGFFIMAMAIMRKHQHKKKDSGKFLSIRKWIKTAASLTTVMGLTWITGVIVFHKALIPVAYIFTISVAFEGVAIFVLFVVVSKQVREALLVCVRDRVNDSEFLSEHIGTRFEKLTPNSTKSRRESTVRYYKNLQKQRRVSNESSKALSQATLKHHYIGTNTHGCVIHNEASVSGDSPYSCSAAVDAGVKGQEYETQILEVMINDDETVATQA